MCVFQLMLKGNQTKAFEACARREQQRVFLLQLQLLSLQEEM